MNLTEARTAVATALSDVPGLNIRPGGELSHPRSGDGWTTVSRIVPSTFRQSLATITAVICLSPDVDTAETLTNTYAIQVIDAVTHNVDGVTDVAVETINLIAGTNSAPIYALALTLSIEVENT